MNNGLTVPDVAVRVGGAMAVGVRQQDVIVHRDSTRTDNEVKQVYKMFLKRRLKRRD